MLCSLDNRNAEKDIQVAGISALSPPIGPLCTVFVTLSECSGSPVTSFGLFRLTVRAVRKQHCSRYIIQLQNLPS